MGTGVGAEMQRILVGTGSVGKSKGFRWGRLRCQQAAINKTLEQVNV